LAFEPGNKLAKGRPKGSKNKDKSHVESVAERLGVDPFEILLLFAGNKWKELGYESETVTKYGQAGVVNEEFVIEPTTRSKAAAEACQYLYPKKKAVDHTISNGDEATGFKMIIEDYTINK